MTSLSSGALPQKEPSPETWKVCTRCKAVTNQRRFGVLWRCSECGNPGPLEAIYPGHPDYDALSSPSHDDERTNGR